MKRQADPTDPLAWLARARSNLKRASMGSDEAVQARYPGWDEDVTMVEYQQALRLARRVVDWVQTVLGEEG